MLEEMYYTLAQRWALAMAGVIHEINQGDARWPGGTPPTDEGHETARRILQTWWDVSDRAGLEDTLAWLRDHGHRATYAAIAAGGADGSEMQRRFVADNAAALGDKTIAAWDLGRIAAVAGWGARAALITEARAFTWMMAAAKEAQRTFASWGDFAQNYCMGCWFWRPEASAAAVEAANRLVARADSPWNELPWTQSLDGPVARRTHVRAVACRACGAKKVRPGPLVGASAYVHCDYCGELTDIDYKILIDSAGSARPHVVLNELLAHHGAALAAARAARDEAGVRAVYRAIQAAMTIECPANYSPRIADGAYREQVIVAEAEMAVTSDLDDETQRLGLVCADATRALREAIAAAEAAVGPVYRVEDLPRVPSAPFWAMIDALEPMQRHVTRTLDERGLLEAHPDRLTPALHGRIATSVTVQSWLPFLTEDDAATLLARAGLAAEYVAVPDVQTIARHCGGCGGGLEVVEGATRVVCDFCGRRVAVGAAEIACPGCGAHVSIADGASSCPYCAVAFT
jgi:hypothetical protein